MRPRLNAAMLASVTTILFVVNAYAFDVSPLKPGDAVDTPTGASLSRRYENRPNQPWAMPDPSDIPNGPQGDLIRFGMTILTDTSRTIGPQAPDQTQRYSANNLNCVHCHEAGSSGLPGTKPFALPFVNLVNDYPKLDIKSMRIVSIEDRIRQMCGKGAIPFTHDSRAMRAVVAYITWLDAKAKPGMRMEGTGLQTLAMPDRAADPHIGARLFEEKCAVCHTKTGAGVRRPDFDAGGGYQFPPIAGTDTYDDGGHMYMIPLLARFIHANMPFGATAATPVLSIDEAYDIAAYVDSALARRHSLVRPTLYPDPAFRPSGFVIPEMFQNEAAYEAARFGPYKDSGSGQ